MKIIFWVILILNPGKIFSFDSGSKEIGYVYILTNAALNYEGRPLIKIGYSKKGRGNLPGIEKRLKELNNTSIPFPFYEFYKLETSEYKKFEKILHQQFKSVRVNPNKEYFLLDPIEAKSALEELAHGS